MWNSGSSPTSSRPVMENTCTWYRLLKLNFSQRTNFTNYIISRECGNRYKNEQVKINDDGVAYRRNAFEAYPHECAICGYNEEERILEVHHIDENRGNNKIDNLVILCPNCHKKITLHLSSYEELLDKYRR